MFLKEKLAKKTPSCTKFATSQQSNNIMDTPKLGKMHSRYPSWTPPQKKKIKLATNPISHTFFAQICDKHWGVGGSHTEPHLYTLRSGCHQEQVQKCRRVGREKGCNLPVVPYYGETKGVKSKEEEKQSKASKALVVGVGAGVFTYTAFPFVSWGSSSPQPLSCGGLGIRVS